MLTLADHNVSYIQLSGEDEQLDHLHRVPEPIILRIFLAAQVQPDGRIKVTALSRLQLAPVALPIAQLALSRSRAHCCASLWQRCWSSARRAARTMCGSVRGTSGSPT